MKIIIESGATKSSWRLLDGTGVRSLEFPGMNVSTMPMEHVLEVLYGSLAELGVAEAEGLYLYTAGVVTPEIRSQLVSGIRERVAVKDIDIQDDMMAAARAVCGNGKGIVAILGTGSNTCFFDGSTLSQNVRSGGYIIGDEGGGASLGKIFLADLVKGLVPSDVRAAFAEKFDDSYAGVVSLVYKSPTPAASLGSIAPVLLPLYDKSEYVKGLIDGNFRLFIERSLKAYDTASYPVGVVGGWGYVCRDIFSRLCADSGIRTGTFVKAPIDGLVNFHA